MINKFIRKLKKIAARKHVLDYIIAIITIPVLLSLLITNILNLQAKNKAEEEKATETKVIIEKEVVPTTTEKQIIITPSESCKKEIGPISISSPKEGEDVSDNPVCITIKHDVEEYCSVVWSYRINGGKWSEYSSNSVCLYDMPEGDVEFDLRIQSTVSDDQETLSRNFVYTKSKTATPTATPEE